MKRKDLIEAIFSSMQTLHRGGAAKLQNILSSYDITSSQLELLFIVKHCEAGISFKALADRMQLTPGAVTQMVNKLVEKHFVTRQEDLHDRRVSYVLLTDTGRSKLKKMWQERMHFMRTVMDDLTDEELELMHKIYQRLAMQLRSESTERTTV